ncbi:MAG: ABC transporter substrate-binding protein [Neptuniibacter sp.]
MFKMRNFIVFLKCILCLFLSGIATHTLAETKKLLIIDSENAAPYTEARASLLLELEERGYKTGENLEVSYYNINNNKGTGIRVLRAEAGNHDVIFTNGTIASLAAHTFGYANPEHKFVYCSVTDPIGLGLIQSFNQPANSNFTGVAYGIPVYERLHFLRLVLPEARTLAMIHSDLPQSKSYVKWLKDELSMPEFKDLRIIFVEIPFLSGEHGSKRMIRQMEHKVQELSPVVDVFLTPSDQFGTKPIYAETISKLSDKPIMALTEQELKLGWGSHFGAYPNQENAGRMAARMVLDLFNGSPMDKIESVYSNVMYGIHKPYTDRLNAPLPNSIWVSNQITVFHK